MKKRCSYIIIQFKGFKCTWVLQIICSCYIRSNKNRLHFELFHWQHRANVAVCFMPIKFQVIVCVTKAFKFYITCLFVIRIKVKIHLTWYCKINTTWISNCTILVDSDICWSLIVSWRIDILCSIYEYIRNPEIFCLLKIMFFYNWPSNSMSLL